MNNSTRKITGWILIFAGIIVVAFFRRYTGHLIPYPWLFYLVGSVCLVAGFFMVKGTVSRRENKLQNEFSQLIRRLRSQGEQVVVDLDKCEIKENHYYQEPDLYEGASDLELHISPGMVAYYNAMKHGTSTKQVLQSVAVYKTDYKGKKRVFYSAPMAKDRATILFRFADQKHAVIYVDRNDPSLYYFDLEFIYE